MGDPAPVARKLCDLGNRLGFYDEVEHYRQFIPDADLKNPERPAGELVVFVSQGSAPVKIPHDIVLPPSIRFSFSTYDDRSPSLPPPSVLPLAGAVSSGIISTDVGEVLKASLAERLVEVIAKETARVIAKEAIAHNMNDDNVEALVRIAFFLMEVPDTRCWQTLPAYLSMVRVSLKPGENQLRLKTMGTKMTLPEINAIPGTNGFYHYYSVQNGSGPVIAGGPGQCGGGQ